MKLRTPAEMFQPQPAMAAVIARYLERADRESASLHTGNLPPRFETPSGAPIFPLEGEELWLTDVQLRKEKATEAVIEDGPLSDDFGADEDEKVLLPDDDTSDGTDGGCSSDSSLGAMDDSSAIELHSASTSSGPTSANAAPVRGSQPCALWR